MTNEIENVTINSEEQLKNNLLDTYLEMAPVLPQLIKNIPLYKSTMIDKFISINGLSIGYLPVEVQTPERCILAVQSTPEAITVIDEAAFRMDAAIVAIDRNPKLIANIAEEKLNEELCKLAVLKDPSVIDSIPDKFLTEELELELVERDICNLEYIRKPRLMTCVRAIHKSAESLKYMHRMSFDIILLAIKLYGGKEVVKNYGYDDNMVFEFRDMVLACICDDPEAFWLLPAGKKDQAAKYLKDSNVFFDDDRKEDVEYQRLLW